MRSVHMTAFNSSLMRQITIDSNSSAAATPPTYVSQADSPATTYPAHPSSIVHLCTARTFPVNGTFTPPQRELYSALLAAQKALVDECAVARGHSLDSLHRRSVELLRTELAQVGMPCAGPVLERVLYPHYLAHPIGIGMLPPPFSFSSFIYGFSRFGWC